MSKRPVRKHLLRVVTLSLVILLMGGGIALLYQWHLGTTASQASSDNVVGPPSLPAANVDAIFRRLGSPMVGTGQAVEAASRAQNIDDAFALAVWWTETNDGAAGVGLADRNPGSVRGSVGYPSAYDGYTIYPSYSAAVTYWFSMLKKVYINRGLTTVSAISHPYVGTSTSNLWAGKVITLMQRYRAEAPPPQATAVPTHAIPPDLKRQGQQLSQDQQQQGTGKSTYYPPVASQSTQNTSASGVIQVLSGNTKTLVVLFDLGLALALALGAWVVGRRYSKRPRPALASAPQMTSSVWEQMRVSGQQPASFFNNFSGPLRTTDNLVPGLAALRTTEALTIATSTPGNQISEELLPVGAFAGGSAQFQNAWTPRQQPVPSWMGQTGASFNNPATHYAQTSAFANPSLSGLTRPTPNPLHRNRLQSGGDDTVTGPQPRPASISTSGGGLLSRYREMQMQNQPEGR
ncbi:MAG TPA: hypothetical protein VF458_06375 [Ktedonobacteraceae bacterium]